MRVSLLGTGGPRPDPLRQGPATLVETRDVRLLFDAGRGVATQLARLGIAPEQLDAVFITHHHFDHIGGLGDLLMAAWNRGFTKPLPVYGPRGTEVIVAALFERVYRADIRFRVREAAVNGESIESVADIVHTHDVESGAVEFGGTRVLAGRVEHGESALGLEDDEWTAVGYRIEGDERVATITGDAVAGRDIARLAREADALVACSYLAGDEVTTDEERFLVEHVIAGAPQAAQIAADAACRRLVLTHLREKSEHALDAMVVQIRHMFEGDIIVGKDLLTIDL